MLAVGLRYLCGWSMSTDSADRSVPEWPPHPDRLFMALAAAHFQTDGDPDERQALEWLEGQAPPSLAVSDARFRSHVTTYVPVNDSSLPRVRAGTSPSAEQIRGGAALLPENRPRQPRHFPVALPDESSLHFVWAGAEPRDRIRRSLDLLCRKVTCVGHSASLVQLWLDSEPPIPTLIPRDGDSPYRLRVFSHGRLAQLEQRYAAGMRPTTARAHGYAPGSFEPRRDVCSSVFSDDLIVLKAAGQKLGLESALQLTDALHATVLRMSVQPPPEWVSGHQADGTPSLAPHVAYMPLPHVGRPHADGHVLGVGIVVPRAIPAREVARVLRPVVRAASSPSGLHVYNGRVLDVTLRLCGLEDRPRALEPATWTAEKALGASRWATVTPIVLDRYPKKNGDAERIVMMACERLGLPTPEDVGILKASVFAGGPATGRFPAYARRGTPARAQVHAVIRFAAPVVGPVMLGAGRYRGYGLCRPFRAEETE